MKLLRRSYFALLYALPAVLFFSYYPIISLGGNVSMNFELSLPLLWLPLFDLVVLVALGRNTTTFKRPSATNGERNERRAARNDGPAQACRGKWLCSNLKGISDRKFFLFALFPLYATLSIFWSPNHLRAILTAGIIWLLFFAVFAIIYITPLLKPTPNFHRTLLKTFFISSAIICLICWLQTILDALGVSREHTLLCPGCVSQTFGFPHPSGFAIEPQFMGNLLLAPTLLSLYLLVAVECRGKNYYLLLAGACLFASTLFLTFSRGAIYAFAVAIVVLIIFTLARHQFRPALIIIPVVTFIFTLTMQGVFNVIGPIHDSFCSGVTKSLNQLSLGIIDLRSACPLTPAQKSIIQQLELPEDMATEIVTNTQSAFDGYIAESTDIRLGLNAAAIDTWLSAPGHPESSLSIGLKCPGFDPCNAIAPLTPTSILFGVGLGGAGTALHQNAFITGVTSSKEIVQNQPISLLLELGLVGIILIIFSLLLAFCPQIFPAKFVNGRRASASPERTFWQHPALPLLLSLIVAYLVTLQFFSGLPNALQIYLLPPLLYLVLSGNEKPIALSK